MPERSAWGGGMGTLGFDSYINCSYFLIFLNSELVAWNNTCKMALRNMRCQLSIQRSRT